MKKYLLNVQGFKEKNKLNQYWWVFWVPMYIAICVLNLIKDSKRIDQLIDRKIGTARGEEVSSLKYFILAKTIIYHLLYMMSLVMLILAFGQLNVQSISIIFILCIPLAFIHAWQEVKQQDKKNVLENQKQLFKIVQYMFYLNKSGMDPYQAINEILNNHKQEGYYRGLIKHLSYVKDDLQGLQSVEDSIAKLVVALGNTEDAKTFGLATIQAFTETPENFNERLLNLANVLLKKQLDKTRIKAEKLKETLSLLQIAIFGVVVAFISSAILLSLIVRIENLPEDLPAIDIIYTIYDYGGN